FVLLGIAAVSEVPERAGVLDMRRPTGGSSRRVAMIVAGVVAAVSFALPAIAARFTASAYDLSANHPDTAVHRLDRAASLNPLSSDPLLARAIVQRRLGNLTGAVSSLDDAIGREDNNWFAYFERGMVQSRRGKWPEATADLVRAKALNPRQRVIDGVQRAIAAHHPVDPDAAERALTAQLDAKIHPLG
ncbi:MAG: hypothetical protein QOG68_2755, partial [Solirubrobacteraceae bacterium]|nr:hypothetical protein [Solirubrobacteraceae bacterium]